MTTVKKAGSPSIGLRRVRNVAELFGIMLAIAEGSAKRFDTWAAMLDRHRNEVVVDLVRSLADDERAEVARIRALAQSSGCAPEVLGDFDWIEREGLPDAALAEAGGAWLVTTYGALAFAVRKEERLFAFLAEITAQPVDPPVREWAETLGRKTLGRIVELRLARRRASRAQYRPLPIAHTLAQFRHIAKAIESEAARQARLLAHSLESLGNDTDAGLLDAIALEAEENAVNLGDISSRAQDGIKPRWRFSSSATPRDSVAALRTALSQTEERFEVYMKLAETAPDEEIARSGRALAGQVVARLSKIANRLAQLHDEAAAR